MSHRFRLGMASALVSLVLGSALVIEQTAWAYDDQVIVNSPGDGFLALRSEPTTKGGRRLAKIPHGTTLRLGVCQPTSNGSWCQTSYQGLTGWILDRYVVSVDAVTANRSRMTGTTSSGDRPVMVGGDPDFSGCSAFGAVRGLKRDGDGFLALRSGPSSKARMIDKLGEGDGVYLCDDAGNGWFGVVVYPPNPMIDCGVNEAIVPKQPYSGPCKTGWVSENFVEVVAP
ncbi:SH3 domain-containing protein [Allochromatium palmeri]|uniref:SH3 domain-containing protein n=1 Tax=Allochromatium palmeri TaxID=231048 RepID=A0A6N8EJD2_9GAMM|nr:SH3 domain-containing protein [Allochromatium palmeri]MTW22617.1 SH3 domain-containing protein [Allochromatium palmeri]